MARGKIVRRFTLGALAVAFTACSEPITGPSVEEYKPLPTEENNPETPPPEENGLALIQCERADFDFAWAFAGPLTELLLSLDGHSLVVPPGALLNPALLTIKQPATRFVEVEVRVNFRQHFQFAAPVKVTLDYSRCDVSTFGSEPLTVVEINPFTKEIIGPVEGGTVVDEREALKIHLFTNHFSGYAVAQ